MCWETAGALFPSALVKEAYVIQMEKKQGLSVPGLSAPDLFLSVPVRSAEGVYFFNIPG